MRRQKQSCFQWPAAPRDPPSTSQAHRQLSDAEWTTANWRGAIPVDNFGIDWDHVFLDTFSLQGPRNFPPQFNGQPLLGNLTQRSPDSYCMELPADFEEQQDAAREYEPKLEGPNVSPQRSTQELVVRYASSNAAYASKTETLNISHPKYRAVIGDGNCGWRAVFFAFCEILLLLGDVTVIQRHHRRLQRQAESVHLIGEAFADLYDDFSDELEELFNLMPVWLRSVNPVQELEKFMNEIPDTQRLNIIYCLRLLTSSHMRAHRDAYEAFLDVPFETYCSNNIERCNEEIEEQGLAAFCDMLLVPAGIGLSVINLHNNPGSSPDFITYHTPSHPSHGGPFDDNYPPEVQVLYTPGHYDLIYRGHQLAVNVVMDVPYPAQVLSTPAGKPDGVDVNLLSWFPADYPLQSTLQPLVDGSQTVFTSKENTAILSLQPSSSSSSSPSSVSDGPSFTPLSTRSPSQGFFVTPQPSPLSSPLFSYEQVPQSMPSCSRPPYAIPPAGYNYPPPLSTKPPPCCVPKLSSQQSPRKKEKQVLSAASWGTYLNVGHHLNDEFDPMAPGVGLTPKDFEHAQDPKKKDNKRKANESKEEKGPERNARRKK